MADTLEESVKFYGKGVYHGYEKKFIKDISGGNSILSDIDEQCL